MSIVRCSELIISKCDLSATNEFLKYNYLQLNDNFHELRNVHVHFNFKSSASEGIY